MARNSQRGRKNNNPEGHNQYSNGWMDSAKERPMASAAAAAAAVGAGVFLWSKRNQITDQLSRLSDQITDWAEDMRSNGTSRELEFADGANESSAFGSSPTTASSRGTGKSSRSSGSRKSGGRTSRGMSETGGGNASLGAHSGTTGSGAAI